MIEITKDTIIGDILDVAPQTAPIFLSIGMHCLGCPSSRGETVEEACAGSRHRCGQAAGAGERGSQQAHRRVNKKTKPRIRKRMRGHLCGKIWRDDCNYNRGSSCWRT